MAKKKTDTDNAADDAKSKTAKKKTTKTSSKTKTAATKKAKTTVDAPSVAPSDDKMSIIREFQVKEGDTGSPEVQIALLTARIDKLIGHLKINPSDNHSRRGLLGIVSKRRRLLNYLEEQDQERFKFVTKKLGLK